MFGREGCSPEQSRAMDVLEEALPLIKELAVAEQPNLDELCITNAKFFFPGKITTASIPRGNGWVWNQSRAKITMNDLTENIELCFYKLNTRKIKTSEVPHYKIWVFTLHILPPSKCFSFLWCERGIEPIDTNNNNETNKDVNDEINTDGFYENPDTQDVDVKLPDFDELSLAEFAFLKPFISEEIAKSLGW